MGGACVTFVGEGLGELHTGFWWGDLRDRDHLEDVGLDGRVIFNLNLEK